MMGRTVSGLEAIPSASSPVPVNPCKNRTGVPVPPQEWTRQVIAPAPPLVTTVRLSLSFLNFIAEHLTTLMDSLSPDCIPSQKIIVEVYSHSNRDQCPIYRRPDQEVPKIIFVLIVRWGCNSNRIDIDPFVAREVRDGSMAPHLCLKWLIHGLLKGRAWELSSPTGDAK